MATAARVESVDALKAFKTAMWKFAEKANVALGDAESEMTRMLIWLETEQTTYWAGQVRKRGEIVAKAKEAVRMKKLFKDASGSRQSAVDEEKALAIAVRRFEEATVKYANTRKYASRLQKEIHLYKGQVQRFATSIQVDIPTAAAHLDKLVAALEKYVALAVARGESVSTDSAISNVFAGSELEASMARPEPAPATAPLAAPASAGVEEVAEPVPWSTGPIIPRHLELLNSLNIPRDPLNEEENVVISDAARPSSHLTLLRDEPTVAGDSGWFLGESDDPKREPGQAIPIAQLLAERADLRDILTLRKGFRVWLKGAGIAALKDDEGNNLWARLKDQLGE